MVTQINTEDFVSIGELARLTGISSHSLRIWEKRYGSPSAHRLPSGHRRYSKADIPRLRIIAKALDSGYRASRVVTESLEQLHTLMGIKQPVESKSNLNISEELEPLIKEKLIDTWVNHVRECDDDKLLNGFHEEWGRKGGLSFITNYAIPFLARIGSDWEENNLKISNEHFATECLVGFFSEKWRQTNIRKKGVKVLVTTLPGEPYNLGALMCAVVTSITDSKVIYLGIDTPIEEIVTISKTYKPKIIALSISHAMNMNFSEDCLFKIRNDVNNETLIITGGKGSPCNIRGVSNILDFNNYYDFLIKFKALLPKDIF
jgi:DNA-binding transcriptional MerR regulator/methylmalonyl-CoA mutase cobalamin-binding subunit